MLDPRSPPAGIALTILVALTLAPATLLRLGGSREPRAGLGVLKLVEQGKIDLDAEVQNDIPSFPRKP